MIKSIQAKMGRSGKAALCSFVLAIAGSAGCRSIPLTEVRGNIGALNPSLRGYWQGNSELGQLADSSGNHRDLTVVRSVANPSEPIAFEGDRWLGHDFFSTKGYFIVPPAAVPSNEKGKFVVAFYHGTMPCCGAVLHQTILSMRSEDQIHFLRLGYAAAGVHGFFIDYSNNEGGLVSLGEVPSPNLRHEPGARIVVEARWDKGGMSLYENGVLINHTDTPWDHGVVKDVWLGVDGENLPNITQNYLDAAAFYDDPEAEYPPRTR